MVRVKVRARTCCVDGLSNVWPQVRVKVEVKVRVITCCVDGLSNSWPQVVSEPSAFFSGTKCMFTYRGGCVCVCVCVCVPMHMCV